MLKKEIKFPTEKYFNKKEIENKKEGGKLLIERCSKRQYRKTGNMKKHFTRVEKKCLSCYFNLTK